MKQEGEVVGLNFKLAHLRFLMRRPKQRSHDLLLLAQIYRLVPGDELYSISIPRSTATGALVISHVHFKQ